MEREGWALTDPLFYKSLRRNVTVEPHAQDILVKVRLKGLYLKNVEHHDFGINAKSYLKGKQAHYLQKVSVKNSRDTRYTEMVKNAKRLKKFSQYEDFHLNLLPVVITLVKRLPKSLEHIKLDIGLKKYNQLMPSLYRNLIALKKLKEIHDLVGYREFEESNFLKKFTVVDQYLPRLKHLAELEPSDYYFKFHDRLNSRSCLAEKLKKFRQTWFEESKHDEKEDTYSEEHMSEINDNSSQFSEEVKDVHYKKDQNDQIVMFFRFKLFPNLRKLHLSLGVSGDPQLDSFAITGFRSLQNLEHLSLRFQTTEYDYRKLFAALHHLPLLKRITLDFYFLEDDLSELITEFLQKQTQICSLSIHHSYTSPDNPKKQYKLQNLFLENIGQCLSNKPNLKYLRLSSGYWNLESLAKGLDETEIIPNLQYLDIDVFDDRVGSSLSAEKRAKGLCNFLQKHQKTLQSFECRLRSISDVMIVDNIIKAIKVLKELRVLRLLINDKRYSNSDLLKKIHNRKKSTDNKFPRFAKTAMHLRVALWKLENLNELYVYMISEYEVDFSNALGPLIALKALRRVHLRLPFLSIETLQYKNMDRKGELLQLDNVTKISIKDSYMGCSDDIEEITPQIERKQSLRCDLMFYQTNQHTDIWESDMNVM